MELEIENGELRGVQHNSCKRGVEYAKQEFYDPRRMVTATATVENGVVPRIPVRTSQPLPVAHINALLAEIYRLTLSAPLEIGTAVIKNFADTGVDVVTTRTVAAR